MRILCAGAHPDDVEIGMGGSAAAFAAQGHEVLLLDLTNGEPTPIGSVERRAQEAARAAASLGVRRQLLGLPNRYLEDTIDNRNLLASEIRKFKPDYIFAPYKIDAHPDHVAASSLVDAARFYAKLHKASLEGEPHFVRRIIYYFPVHLRLAIQPSFLLDISSTLVFKEQAIHCYESQFAEAKARLIEEFLRENRNWGFKAGCLAAEPFFQHEVVALTGWPDGYL